MKLEDLQVGMIDILWSWKMVWWEMVEMQQEEEEEDKTTYKKKRLFYLRCTQQFYNLFDCTE